MKPQVEHYNSQWPIMFEEEKYLLEQVFLDQAEEIFHFGSTSIPGMTAKPIIDIKVRMRNMPANAELLKLLVSLGYMHRETPGEPLEKYMRFDKGNPVVTHCLHLLLSTEPDHTKNMRDYLRTHPDDALLYSQLKWKILQQENVSMLQYRDEKSPFLAEIRKRADLWATKR
eukprot:Phypoly_transcript_20093.p1 GENE.Phypoly_transcript_20093~~Phypoly_transcript_20093.p1  ORF type:complete len:188 (+),score=12.78 Phypoly_transcript_20093:52-564(+)